MDPIAILKMYYTEGTPLYNTLLDHSRKVADKAIALAKNKPELELDLEFVEQAALLHDLGIYACNAPGIHCVGDRHYLEHGVVGAELLRGLGYDKHALVCERHTGTGLSLEEIKRGSLPLPQRDMLPMSMEEKLVCFADKFFSKSSPTKERSLEAVRRSTARFGEESLERLEEMIALFM